MVETLPNPVEPTWADHLISFLERGRGYMGLLYRHRHWRAGVVRERAVREKEVTGGWGWTVFQIWSIRFQGKAIDQDQ